MLYLSDHSNIQDKDLAYMIVKVRQNSFVGRPLSYKWIDDYGEVSEPFSTKEEALTAARKYAEYLEKYNHDT